MRYATKVGARDAVRTVAAALALLLGVAACDDGAQTPLTPDSPDGGPQADIQAARQGGGGPGNAPFYYYQGEKVVLETVPGQFVVKAKAGVDLPAAAEEALADKDLPVQAGRALAEGHRIVEVPGAGRGEAKGLARRLRNHPGLTFASPAYRTQAGGDEVLPLNTLIVMFEESASSSEIRELNERLGTTIQREPVLEKGWRYHILRLPEDGGKSALEIAAAYYEHPLVKWADLNRVAKIQLESGSSEPLFGEQWYLDGNSQTGPDGVPVDINATDAWDNTEGSSSVRVVMLDTGVDGGHEDLDDLVDGGDGTGEGNNSGLERGDRDNRHGTAVAGIIAANHNGVGVAGVAPEVTLVSVQIISNVEENATLQEIADFLNKAWDELDADVINNSWSLRSGTSDCIAKAVEWATKDGRGGKGSVVVFSAGNESSDVNFPAELPEAIAVSAINRSGDLSDFSNRGPEVDIAAPGGSKVRSGSCSGDMPTLDPMGTGGCDDGPSGNDNYTSSFNGTSASAPQVSGAAALLISTNSSLTVSEVRQRLTSAADPWGDSDKFGAGKLNVGSLFVDDTPDVDGDFDSGCGNKVTC